MVTFENKEYLGMLTAPSIPYALYIHEDYLLLVPREVNQKHPKFPTIPDQNKRYTLRVGDRWSRIFTEINEPPKFTREHVAFGLQKDVGLVIMALLRGKRRIVLYWVFNTILASTETEIEEHHNWESVPSIPDNFFDKLKLDPSSTA